MGDRGVVGGGVGREDSRLNAAVKRAQEAWRERGAGEVWRRGLSGGSGMCVTAPTLVTALVAVPRT